MNDSVWPTIHVAGELDRARAEWVHANAAGAFASSTVAQMHTRRYHGLLVAALEPPRRRHVIVSHVDASVVADGSTIRLATHQFPGVRPTAGYRFLTQFSQDPLPRWVYDLRIGELEQTLCLVRGHNCLVIRYLWRGAHPIPAELRPLLAMRPFHGLVREHGAMIQRVELRPNEVSVRPVPALPRVVFRHWGAFVGSPDWWRRFEYLHEQTRGMDFQEDLWTPGVFRLTLQPDEPAFLVCGVEQVPEDDPERMMRESAEALRACDPGPGRAAAVRRLHVAAELFRADHAPTPGVIAGYPWFEIWGRHTLLSLSGLYLIPGRYDGAKRVVETLVRFMRAGLVPNRLPDDGSPAEYHAVDATLLLMVAAGQLWPHIEPQDPFVSDTLLPALRSIFETMQTGAPDGIHLTADGLIAAGTFDTSLTWMDARVDGRPVTARSGLAVETQALWSKGCASLAEIARACGEEDLAHRANQACERARDSFRKRFWCTTTSYPFDVISETSLGPDGWVDPAIRPNAIFALAIDPDLFTQEQAEAMIDVCERELVTPAGVRTLSPREPGYHGVYAGGVIQRDRCYHQGTAWPFLMGAYSRAVRHTYPQDAERVSRLRAMLEAMLGHGLAVGQISEFANGDQPHRADGCVAHAPGVAELLRALVEDCGL